MPTLKASPKIAIITTGAMPVPPTLGGAVEHLIYMLVRENEEAPVPFQFTVFSMAPGAVGEYPTNQRHTRWEWIERRLLHRVLQRLLLRRFGGRFSPVLKNYPFFLKAVRRLREETHDLVVFQNRPDILEYCSRRLAAPLALYLQNEYLSFPRDEMARAVIAADRVLACSSFIGRQLGAAFPTHQQKVRTVLNGIDAQLFDRGRWAHTRDSVRARLGIAPDDFVILYSGRLVPAKGADRLLQAVARLGDLPKAKVLVVGATGYSEDQPTEFSRSVRDAGARLKDRVIFTGYVKYEEMPQYYGAADIAVLPFIFEEPFGLTVIESMSMELPVITTDSGGVPEIVTAECGEILPRSELEPRLEESIRRLYHSPSARSKMGAAGRTAVLGSFTSHHLYQGFRRSVEDFWDGPAGLG
jgi:glycosyltransferase involved in cell wall biosynthesis